MLKDSFCSSPWFHIRINPAGYFLPCRWFLNQTTSNYNIANTSIAEYMNSATMSEIRTDFLEGRSPDICNGCYYEDSHNKVSGRQRQLLKSAITLEKFTNSFCSSPHWKDFSYSATHHGQTTRMPTDLQIDLGNTCNSSCIMCSPLYSSKLKTDYDQLVQLEPSIFKSYTPFKNWADNPQLVDKFVNELSVIPNIRYIHFIGGETLYLKSFYTICNRLIELGLAKDISIGTTTNCTVYTAELERIIREFKHVHLGLSVEALHTVNDYIRWPSKIDAVSSNIAKFLQLRKDAGLHVSLRITPNIFSIYHLDTVFKFMLDEKITAESCNILSDPSCLRIELLPKELIKQCLDKFDHIIQTYQLAPSDKVIVNRRNDNFIDPVIAQIIFEYKHLLENYIIPNNIEEERYNLVKFTRAFEQLRNNSILDHLPEYEEFLRSYGY